jgi:obg-like ATPase 1
MLTTLSAPIVGKSTLFNLLSKMGIPAENFPFCTIEPNSARVNVPDERFKWLCDLYKPKSQVPAFLEVVDIAGLVRGASSGEGLGNAFLSHIAAVDGIMHVCRAFEDSDIVHVEDRVDPVADLEIIHQELRLKDLEKVNGIIESINKLKGRGLKKDQIEELECCEKLKAWMEEGKDVRFGDW